MKETIINGVVEAIINLAIKAIVTLTTHIQITTSIKHIQRILAEVVANNTRSAGSNPRNEDAELIIHRVLMHPLLARS